MIYDQPLEITDGDVLTIGDCFIERNINGGRKRMRLHQLSWEEKIQRKKLRNRIAAQTSRDRKKARMDHLEETVKELQVKNFELFTKIKELQEQNEYLTNANTELKEALSLRQYSCSCQSKTNDTHIADKTTEKLDSDQHCISVDHLLEVPAESSNDPQQKGRKALVQDLMSLTSGSLWKIFILYLLTQKCWEISKATHSSMTWKNWQQVCYKKLNNMKQEEQLLLWKKRPQKLIRENAGILIKWWGKHQKNWNPVEVMS